MISGVIFSGKTIFRIHRGNRWEILQALMRKDPSRKYLYSELEKALSFLEIFRQVYQLFVGLEEDIYLDNPGIVDNLQTVAQTLGYNDIGAIRAWDHLLIHYHEFVESAKKTTDKLLEDREGMLISMDKIINIINKNLFIAFTPQLGLHNNFH